MQLHRSLACLLLLALSAPVWAVPSKQYVSPGTSVTWCDSGCTHVLSLNNVPTLNGRIGDRHDKGTGSQPAQWMWACSFTLTGTNVAGAQLEIYTAWSDGTYVDGAVGTTNATFTSADKRRNLKLLGTTIVDQTASNTAMIASGMAWIPSRYFSPVIWNATTLSTQNVNNTSTCSFTPMPFEME